MFNFILGKRTTLSFYVMKRLLLTFGLIVVALTLALSLDRLIRLMQLTVSEGATFGQLLLLLTYLLPHYLGLAIPAGQFFACLLVLRRLHENLEFVVMLTSGISSRQLIRPLLGFSIFLTLVMLVLTGLIQPYTRYAYRASLYELVHTRLFQTPHPGIFVELTDQMTIRAEKVNSTNKKMTHFFASIQEEDNKKSIFTAKTATLRQNPDTQHITLFLEQGTFLREEKGKEPLFVRFDSYAWNLSLFHQADPYAPRGNHQREMTFGELLSEETKTSASFSERLSEFHAKLAQSFSLPLLTLLALPLALLGQGRGARAYGIGLGIGLFVLYQQMLAFAKGYALVSTLPVWLILWSPFLLLLAVLLLLAWRFPIRQTL